MTLDIKTLTTAELHDEMLRLRQERHMDFLVNLIGMDWEKKVCASSTCSNPPRPAKRQP